MNAFHRLWNILARVPALRSVSERGGRTPLARYPESLAVGRGERSDYDHFFRYTTGRWIYNEQEQTRIRYVSFNVDALKRVATEAARANHCTDIVKAAEGSFNKIFRLSFDNGTQLIAKIPCPLSAPRRLCTASEVATMDYARNILNLPVPCVLRWSADADTSEIGTEYILMEHVQGVELYKRKNKFRKDGCYFVERIVDVEKKFTARRFSQIGSLYYKEDVSPVLQERPLYADGEEVSDGESDGSDRFRIGPCVDWNIWRGRRNELDVDRGPWPDTVSYIKGLINVEKLWLSKFAIPRDPHDIFYRSSHENSPLAHIQLLDQFLAVIPHLLPPDVFCAPVLWHNDLHAANVFVASEGQPDISGIIDWQGACIEPLFLQPSAGCLTYTGDSRIVIPPGLTEIPKLPLDFDTYPPTERSYLRIQHRQAMFHKLYQIENVNRNRLYVASQMCHPHIQSVISCIQRASRTWDQGTWHLRQGLLDLERGWEDVVIASGGDAPGGVSESFPISWDEDEIARHRIEYARFSEYEDCITEVIKELQLEGDGWVTDERYEEVMRKSRKIQEGWDVRRWGGPYPFQDGGRSWFLS